VDLPLEVLRERRGLLAILRGERRLDLGHLRDQSLGDAAYLARDLGIGIHRPFLAQDLLVGLQPQRLLVLDRQAAVDQHRFAGHRVHRLVGEPVVHAVAREQQQDDEARVDATPARGRLLPVAPTERITSHLFPPALPIGGYRSRTTRNPRRALVVSTDVGARHAERAWAGELAQEPPRITWSRQPGLTQAEPSPGARR